MYSLLYRFDGGGLGETSGVDSSRTTHANTRGYVSPKHSSRGLEFSLKLSKMKVRHTETKNAYFT